MLSDIRVQFTKKTGHYYRLYVLARYLKIMYYAIVMMQQSTVRDRYLSSRSIGVILLSRVDSFMCLAVWCVFHCTEW